MGQVVYADLLFLIDFSMDFLCFYITARLLHRRFSILRCLVGAAAGGIYSVVSIFFSMNVWLGLMADLGVCAIMCLIAYGCKGKSFYEFCLYTSAYFGVSACLGGFMTAIYSILNRLNIPFDKLNASDGISVWLFGLLALMSGLAAMMGGRFFRNASTADIADVEITYGGKSVSVRAFVDTGNMISDPISGKKVIIIDKTAASGIMNDEGIEMALRGKFGLVSADEAKKIRLIPMETAGGGRMLCAFKPDKVTVTVTDNKKRSRSFEVGALFAPSELSISADKRAMGCHALISPDLLA